MHRSTPFSLLVLLVPACGGGGGGGVVTPLTVPVTLQADPLDLGPATSEAELVVQLATDSGQAPVLLQVAVELPPALALAPGTRLLPARSLPTLDGEASSNRLLVLCGDAQNADAAPLGKGPLFRVRLVAASPRQTGTHSVRLTGLLASAADGTPLTVATEPIEVPVRLR